MEVSESVLCLCVCAACFSRVDMLVGGRELVLTATKSVLCESNYVWIRVSVVNVLCSAA